MSYRQRIAAIPGVREVMVFQWFGGVYKDPRNIFARIAVEPDRIFQVRTELKLPEEQKRAFQRERTACMIGRGVADKYGLKLGDRVVIVGDFWAMTADLTVRAIYDNPEDNDSLYFHLKYLHESVEPQYRDTAGTFQILADSPASVPRIARAIDDMFRNSSAQTKTESERAFQLSFVSFLGNVKAILLTLCGAITFTILLVSANTMAMAVRERTREVGVLKTLGFTPGAILSIILGEAALLSLLGALIGCVLAYFLTFAVRKMPALISQLTTLTLTPSVAALLLVIGVLMGVVSAFVPAWAASRTPILETLRHTG
jgi:putative ABC transport system permease protein